MRILFLDDDPSRTLAFRERMGQHELVCVETPDEAKRALDENSKFDIASLDHDLFGKIYQPSDENSGFEVCCHIDEMDAADRPEKVICHSYNPDGVDAMMAMLITGVAAPFNTPEYWKEATDDR